MEEHYILRNHLLTMGLLGCISRTKHFKCSLHLRSVICDMNFSRQILKIYNSVQRSIAYTVRKAFDNSNKKSGHYATSMLFVFQLMKEIKIHFKSWCKIDFLKLNRSEHYASHHCTLQKRTFSLSIFVLILVKIHFLISIYNYFTRIFGLVL